MSILTVADLRARCRVDHSTGCWHWLGAKDHGVPRIFTFDHERGEKRPMSGPKAAWNIAHGEAPIRGWLVYRRCVTTDCLAPVHLAQARDRKEIGLHVGRSNKRKGTALEARRANAAKGRAAAGIRSTPDHIVIACRRAPKSVTNVALAAEHGILHTTVSQIRRGESRQSVVDLQLTEAA